MKQGKKGLSLLIALVMLMSMTMAFTTTAFADDDIKITIKPVAGVSLKDQTFKAYKVFDLTFAGDAYTYTVAAEFQSFFAAGQSDIGLAAGLTNPQIAAFLETKGADADFLANFADLLFRFIKASNIQHKGQVKASSNAGATINLDELGYYLVTGSTTIDGTDTAVVAACSLTTTDPTAEVTPKVDFPTLSKEVEGGDQTSASIGDTVYFKITSTIPSQLSGYTKYKYIIHDRMDGFEYNYDLVVTVGGIEIYEEDDYRLLADSSFGGYLIIITLDEDKTLGYKGKEVVVTYSGTLNEHAVVGAPGNLNKAYLEFSNDPSSDGTGTSVTEVVPTYTYKIDINKFARNNGSPSPLAGAEFELRAGSPEGEVILFMPPEDVDGTSVIAISYEFFGDSTVSSPESGLLTLKGFGPGTYYLTEVQAPDGYNLLPDPIEIVIATEGDGIFKVTYGDGGEGIVEVENLSGTQFPATGGIGRTIFTISGSILMAGALAALYFRRKVSE